ncbi:hypothetical protein FACS1894133_0720 [Clostridia bacterium]|nr:hypothetical protein FACS1894133_0070 [Clostridia bacterium]GHU57571.1 hypothetical protein FACS1894133_0720 [Clostridia bacterium]
MNISSEIPETSPALPNTDISNVRVPNAGVQQNGVLNTSVSNACATAAFFALLSLPPFAAASLILYKALFGTPPDLTAAMLSFFPNEPHISGFAADLLNEITRKANGTILSLSALTLLYSASHIVSAVRSVIYRAKNKRDNLGAIRRKAWCIAVSAIITVAAASCILLFARFGAEYAASSAGITLVVIFALLRLLTGGFVGSVVGTVLFVGLNFLYAHGVLSFLGYSAVYGSFATVAMSMMWLYLLAMILFISTYVQTRIYSFTIANVRLYVNAKIRDIRAIFIRS